MGTSKHTKLALLVPGKPKNPAPYLQPLLADLKKFSTEGEPYDLNISNLCYGICTFITVFVLLQCVYEVSKHGHACMVQMHGTDAWHRYMAQPSQYHQAMPLTSQRHHSIIASNILLDKYIIIVQRAMTTKYAILASGNIFMLFVYSPCRLQSDPSNPAVPHISSHSSAPCGPQGLYIWHPR